MSSRPLGRSRLLAGGLAALLLVALLAVLGSAEAAMPASGTVSDVARTVSWSAGPFLVANPTGAAAGAPDCTAPNSCDDFALSVATPARYEDTHDLQVSVSWPNAAADFDVYLLDSAGAIVASAASSADPEVILKGVPAGAYTVRVVPYTPLGDSFTATATLLFTGAEGAGPAAGAPSIETAPGFVDYAAPASLAAADDAGEPSIGNSFPTDATLYQAGLATFKVTFDDSATPARATWSDVSATAATGCVAGSTTSLDPILYTDHTTGRTFESQLTGVNSATCYTDDDGKTWAATTGGGIPAGVDHQTLGGGPYSPNGTVGPLNSYPNTVYYCSQDIGSALCAASKDGGTTFGAGVPTYTLLDCGGLHGHIKVAPDGTAYLPNKGCNGEQAAVTSEDGGTTWDIRPVPGTTEGESDPSVGVGRNGTVYFGYVGANGKPGVATSNDRGRTWSNLQTVGSAFDIKNAVFPTMVAGDDDRASFAYLGTPTGGNAGETGVFPGVWHLYVDTTYDGGKTWVTSDATPDDPVQRGSICTAGTTCGDDRNLLDFMDMTIDDQGRVLVGFADGCIAACVTDRTVNTHNSYSTIARQSSGKPLFAKFDPAGSGSGTGPGSGNGNGSGNGAGPGRTNAAPVARASGPGVVRTKQQVTLSAVGSSDDQTPASGLTYAWNFGTQPGAVDATGPVVRTAYAKRGRRTATVTVTDAQGLRSMATVPVTVERRRACETSRFRKVGPWRLVHRGGDHHKHCDNLGRRTTAASRDRIDLSFDGSALTLGYGRVRGGGRAVVLVDGTRVGALSFRGRTKAVSFRGAKRTFTGLGTGRHHLVVRVAGRAYLDYAQY